MGGSQMFPRCSGLLLHPTSLPGRFGIGDLGPEAYRFVDFLVAAGQRLWQMLPLGPTGYGNSPYQSLSAFAGNPLLISLDRLVDDGLLERADLSTAPRFPEDSVDFDAIIAFKMPLLKKSYAAFEYGRSEEFSTFCRRNAGWLDVHALFVALRDAHGAAGWNTWERDIRRRQPETTERWTERLATEVRYQQYLQFQFSRQWSALKKCCNDRGVRLIGDIPVFVALDSAEVWAHPEMFFLDEAGKPKVVAGVPPDYFSQTGQLWGNPLYRWDVMARDGYSWWVERFKATREVVDIIRLDHFRGFESYWEVPAGEKTAISGRWAKGPGAHFFEAIKKALGELPIIAEDLGIITSEVTALREQFDLPGMRVLQFAFTGGADNPHRPHNYPRNCVVYTGTHDNNTTVGWFQGEGARVAVAEDVRRERETALKYLGTRGDEINWDLIRQAFMSVANTAIMPVQDVLGLGSEARMNTPGTTRGNWRWRLVSGQLTEEHTRRLAELGQLYGR